MMIKFLTINIWFGGKVWDNLIEFIHSEKPDILTIQEAYNSHEKDVEKRYRTLDEFKKEFGNFLPYRSFGATVFDTGVNIPWGNAVFSKFPIIGSQTIFFDLPLTEYNFTIDPDPRFAAEGMCEAEMLIGDKKVFVYSWHGVWDNHGGDTKNRYKMQDVIIGSLGEKKSVIIAGDTNIRPDTQIIKNIEEKLNLTNVFGYELESTFNMERKTNPQLAHESVDKILVSKDIKVLSYEMPRVDVSDHYPLKALLEI